MPDITAAMIELLLHEGESSTLDFKEEQYSFENVADAKKCELLKDILAFANAFRERDAYILTGVKEMKGERSIPVGISLTLDDASIQQFINSKTNKPIDFSYCVFTVDGMKIGVFRIPVQRRPFFLDKDYGYLKKDTVYIRRGTTTDVARPNEIALMGNSSVHLTIETVENIRVVDLRKEFRRLINRIATTVYVNDYYKRLYDLKQFFLANPEYYELEANRKFFDEWLMRGEVEQRLTSSMAWIREDSQKLMKDIQSLEEL